jgi:hypothetical protein
MTDDLSPEMIAEMEATVAELRRVWDAAMAEAEIRRQRADEEFLQALSDRLTGTSS